MTKLEELKAAYAAATPGEWNNTEQSNGLNSVYGNCQFDSMADADLIAFDIRNGDDAEFITLAHALMPQLLEAVEKTDWISAELQRVRKRCADYEEALGNLLDEIGLDHNDEYYITTHPDNDPVEFARGVMEKLK